VGCQKLRIVVQAAQRKDAVIRGPWFRHVQAIIKALLEHMRAAPPAAGSFADLLQRARDPRTGAPLTSRQIFPEAAALLFAGMTLLLTSAHPAWGELRVLINSQ